LAQPKDVGQAVEKKPGAARSTVSTRRRTYGRGKGRPPIVEVGWHPETGTWDQNSPAGQIISAVRGSNALEVSAAFAGINRATLFNWLARGREYLPEASTEHGFDRQSVPDVHLAYVDFLDSVTKAAASAEVELVLLVRQEARTDPRWATWLLSRKSPTRWGEKQQLVVEDVTPRQDRESAMKALLGSPELALRLRDLAGDIIDLEQ
jgi:hypothetical protein